MTGQRKSLNFDEMVVYSLAVKKCAYALYKDQLGSLQLERIFGIKGDEGLHIAGVTLGATVLLALSMEIVLKAWIGKTGSSCERRGFPDEHNLEKLVKTLRAEVWDVFTNYEESIIRSACSLHANDFLRWRYKYEPQNRVKHKGSDVSQPDPNMIKSIDILAGKYRNEFINRNGPSKLAGPHPAAT